MPTLRLTTLFDDVLNGDWRQHGSQAPEMSRDHLEFVDREGSTAVHNGEEARQGPLNTPCKTLKSIHKREGLHSSFIHNCHHNPIDILVG